MTVEKQEWDGEESKRPSRSLSSCTALRNSITLSWWGIKWGIFFISTCLSFQGKTAYWKPIHTATYLCYMYIKIQSSCTLHTQNVSGIEDQDETLPQHVASFSPAHTGKRRHWHPLEASDLALWNASVSLSSRSAPASCAAMQKNDSQTIHGRLEQNVRCNGKQVTNHVTLHQ